MKKNNKGYLLLECLISLFIVITICFSLYFFLNSANKYKILTQVKVELYEKNKELYYQINKVIESSDNIMSIMDISGKTITGNTSSYVKVKSIKCKYQNEFRSKLNDKDKDKEISYKSNHKLFINTLNKSGGSEPGGYEIGDYVDFISVMINDKKVSIKLSLSKNKEQYESVFYCYMKDF